MQGDGHAKSDGSVFPAGGLGSGGQVLEEGEVGGYGDDLGPYCGGRGECCGCGVDGWEDCGVFNGGRASGGEAIDCIQIVYRWPIRVTRLPALEANSRQGGGSSEAEAERWSLRCLLSCRYAATLCGQFLLVNEFSYVATYSPTDVKML